MEKIHSEHGDQFMFTQTHFESSHFRNLSEELMQDAIEWALKGKKSSSTFNLYEFLTNVDDFNKYCEIIKYPFETFLKYRYFTPI